MCMVHWKSFLTQKSLHLVVADIEQEFHNFGSSFNKKGDNDFVASTDREIAILNRIVDKLCKGIAEVRNTTQIQSVCAHQRVPLT